MHRTTRVPRRLLWSLPLCMLLHFGIRYAAAQDFLPPPQGLPPAQPAAPVLQGLPAPQAVAPPGADGPVIVLPVTINTTKRVEMSNKEIIREVRNENPRVARVGSIPEDPRAVNVTGLAPGTSRLTFIDVKRNVENMDIQVPDVASQEIEANRKRIIDQVLKIVPAAVIDVNVTGPNAAIITGTAPSVESVQMILEAARGVLGGAGANIVNGMRVGGVQQVQLEVVVALVNRSEIRRMSSNWTIFGDQYFLSSVIGTAGGQSLGTTGNFTTSLTRSAGAGFGDVLSNALNAAPNLNFGVLGSRAAFLFFLEALRTENLAKVLAEPRVVTLSGRPAYIISGGETPILQSSGSGAASVAFKQFGTVVNFLPIVLGNGKIYLEVRPELSAINNANGITVSSGFGPTVVPGFSVRSAQVAVQIEDGQTLAIGGLIQNTINASVTKVPILGDLPYLNTLFSSKSYNESEEELLILVTPRLVDPLCCTQIPKYLPGRETRSPDDFELFLEGILEAPRGPRYVSLFHYKGAHTQSPNAGQFPCYGGYLGQPCPSGGMPGNLGGGCADGACGALGGGCVACGATSIGQVTTLGSLPAASYPGLPANPGNTPAGKGMPRQGSKTTQTWNNPVPVEHVGGLVPREAPALRDSEVTPAGTTLPSSQDAVRNAVETVPANQQGVPAAGPPTTPVPQPLAAPPQLAVPQHMPGEARTSATPGATLGPASMIPPGTTSLPPVRDRFEPTAAPSSTDLDSVPPGQPGDGASK